MKQKMKHLVSFIALLAMMVSMFSVCVIPAAAATAEEEYNTLLRSALVVDPDWAGYEEGEMIEFTFRSKKIKGIFDGENYFASFADAWAKAKEAKIADPVILLCDGDYYEEMVIDSGVTLLGPNAGYDPVDKKDKAENEAWELSDSRLPEAVIRHNIYVTKAAGDGDIVIDGLSFGSAIATVEETFGIGGALVDYERGSGSSEITVKNTVFSYAGNTEEAHGYSLYLRSSGHARSLTLQNLYVEGENEAAAYTNLPLSFIAPYFTELYADNIAYINNKNGFLAKTFFGLGVSPTVEITNSCFYNASANTAENYIISMDNQSFDFNFSGNADRLFTTTSDTAVAAFSGDKRPAASLKLHDNVFYNASGKTGVIHYEFTNARSVVDIQNNYVYEDDNNANNGCTIMDTEFVSNSASVDQTKSILIKNNRLIGAYKIPTLKGSNTATCIDMSDNYFATTAGQVVPQPIYIDADNTRLIRERFWVNEEMTIDQSDWFLSIDNWSLASVNNVEYTASLITYAEKDISEAPITYSSSDGFQVQLYSAATVSGDNIITKLSADDIIPNNKLTAALLGDDPYATTTIYAQVTDPNNKNFAPVYTITVTNMGSIAGLKDFAATIGAAVDYNDDSNGSHYYLYNPDLAELPEGTEVPSVWKGEKYLCKAGVNVFSNVRDIIDHAESKGLVNPIILVPAGEYTSELLITGTCTILGEQYGINPNYKPVAYADLTQADYLNSGWKLNSARDQSRESTFRACIRVSEDADDYVITVDGIKMVDGCSYIDDYARTTHNVTYLKNIYADNAGGGLDRTGAACGQVFRFWKAYDANSTDRTDFYMLDCRLDNFKGRTVFGPYFEKFVFDGTYFGNATGGTRFMNSFRSRDIADPYYAVTNSCLWNNAGTGQSGFYMISTQDHNGVLSKKTNIIYNFDGNMWYNATTTGFGGMEINFTGNNMRFYLTNNTMVHTSNSGVFFASTIGTSRFKGTCANENVSDMIVAKNNRMIGQNCLPTTNATGNGTMFDFSGNYFASSVTAAAQTPEQAWRVEVSQTGNLGIYTWEGCIRNKIDYTWMDWDMTVRSNSTADDNAEADYTITTGEFDTGSHKIETVNGKKMTVYRDSVSADCTVYQAPVLSGVNSSVQILDANKNAINANAMNLVGTSTTFYAEITTGKTVEEIMIVIDRELGSEFQLISMDDFYVDVDNGTVTAFLDLLEVEKYRFDNAKIVTSPGATYKVYGDAACTTEIIECKQTEKAYLKVTSEDAANSKVYEITFYNKNNVKPENVGLAAITSIDGMTRVNNTTYKTAISAAAESLTFKPNPLYGSTLEVYVGSTEIAPNADGSYTVALDGVQKITILAICGSNQTEYTLNIEKGIGTDAELENLEFKTTKWNDATKGEGGHYVMNLMYAESALVKATVSDGATYQVYKDAAYEDPYAGNEITVKDDEGNYRDGFDVYLKVTAEDGKNFKTFVIRVYTQAGNRTVARIFGVQKVSDTETVYHEAKPSDTNEAGMQVYKLSLPAGVENIELIGGVMVTEEVLKMNDDQLAEYYKVKGLTGGEVTFFADPGRKIALIDNKAVLGQKETTVYTSTLIGSYYGYNSSGEVETVKINAANAVLEIVSDRATVTYKDAASYQNNWVKPYIEALNNGKYGIFQGDNNGNINVSANITRYEVAAIATRVLGLDVTKFTSGVAPTNYADTIEDWAQPYVRAAAAVGIMNGHNEVTKLVFDGESYATREQVIKVLVSVCVVKEGGTAALDSAGAVVADAATAYYTKNKAAVDLAFSKYTFEDTAKVSEWAVPYMRLAVAEFEMIGGSKEGNKLYLFPQKNITRAEVAKMVAVYFEK